ncbi:unnamed protein product [Gordionus sp. m RMFG-2023]
MTEFALLVTTEQTTRMFFPPNIFCYIFNPIVDDKRKLVQASDTDLVNYVNFMGKGGFLLYREVSKMTAKQAKQIVFHCISGTYKEDFVNWDERNDFGDCFKSMNNNHRSTLACQFNMVFKAQPAYLKFYQLLFNISMRKEDI